MAFKMIPRSPMAKHCFKKLKGNQHKIDMNKDGKISKADFDMLNSDSAMNYGTAYKKKGCKSKRY